MVDLCNEISLAKDQQFFQKHSNISIINSISTSGDIGMQAFVAVLRQNTILSRE
jgi:hypothetical protein